MKLAIVAGEASGDLHAAHVVRELRKLDPELHAFGIGGDLLAAEGMMLLHHAREMGIVGFFNVLRNLKMFRRIFDDMLEAIARERPDAVLLVDYPGFNLRLARRCKEMGLKVVYYISPQVWAWRRGRVKQIERYVDRMLVVFPFEEEFYREHNVSAKYVGHPIVEQLAHIGSAAAMPPPSSPGPQSGGTAAALQVLRILLLPGSRRSEVESLLPPMLDAVEQLRKDGPVEATVMKASTIDGDLLARLTAGHHVQILDHDGGDALASADIAFSSSGTATLECAVAGTPVIVMYRLSRANYWLGRLVIKIPHFSLVNIIAGKGVVPELLQRDVNGGRIAAEARAILEPEAYARMKRELADVRGRLGEEGASRRAAEEIMSVVRA